MREQLESRRFPYLLLEVRARERVHSVEALIDTGFDGDVVLPLDLLGDDGVVEYELRARMADGSEVSAPAYLGKVRLGDLAAVPALVLGLGDEALVGRGVTDRFRLTLDHGERVLVEL